jgi:hypothetical protein
MGGLIKNGRVPDQVEYIAVVYDLHEPTLTLNVKPYGHDSTVTIEVRGRDQIKCTPDSIKLYVRRGRALVELFSISYDTKVYVFKPIHLRSVTTARWLCDQAMKTLEFLTRIHESRVRERVEGTLRELIKTLRP